MFQQSHSWVHTQKTRKPGLKRTLVHLCSRQHHSQEPKAGNPSAPHQQMNRLNMVYTDNGILLSLKKEGHSNTCYNLDESWGQWVKWNKSAAKGNRLHLHGVSRVVKAREREVSSRQREEVGWGSYCLMGMEKLEKMKKVLVKVTQKREYTYHWNYT